MPPSSSIQSRIDSLTQEIDHLRSSRNQSDHAQNELMLKIAEIQLNLAVQDKTLGKLEMSINGNGRPGLLVRLDRVERLASGLTKAVWVLVTASAAALAKMLIGRN